MQVEFNKKESNIEWRVKNGFLIWRRTVMLQGASLLIKYGKINENAHIVRYCMLLDDQEKWLNEVWEMPVYKIKAKQQFRSSWGLKFNFHLNPNWFNQPKPSLC